MVLVASTESFMGKSRTVGNKTAAHVIYSSSLNGMSPLREGKIVGREGPALV